MKNKLAVALTFFALLFIIVKGVSRFHRIVIESWAQEFPVEGLVLTDDGLPSFEQVPLEDIKNLSRIGFPQAMSQLKARVRHLVIYQDCHYFFTTDGRVIVMTPSGDGRTPRLVETKPWRGAPHDFRDYRKELLPTT